MPPEIARSQVQVLKKLAGFSGPVTEGRVTGVPPADRATLLEGLSSQGLVEVRPPSGRARKPSYRITELGRQAFAALDQRRAKSPARPTVASLAARVDDLAARLDRVEAALAQAGGGRGARPGEGTAAEPIPGAVEMSYEAFRAVARDAFWNLDQTGRTLGLVPIPDLRRAMGDRVSRQAFDEHLLRLHRDGVVHLMPHDHPASLADERRRDSVPHSTAGLLYFVRWLEL
jgi:DNA-binding HxlR family transcriptional regulator